MSLFHHRLLMAKALEMANPYLPLDTPKAIKDAMVLYYDIAKQKATNESMAENPTLKDLSGNGNDATCYNFGWTEESGINSTNYPNALVSDGVDDYCIVQNKYDDEGNLINNKSLVLNKEDGYTVIAKRKWINEPTTGTFNPIASKASSITVAEPNAFIFEWNRIANSARNYGCWNFGNSNKFSNITDEDVVYQTSKSYNGQKSLTIGSNEDSDRLYIASLIDNLGFANIALYSLLLFNRDLTDEEIEWVKNNLIVTDLGDFNSDFNNDFNRG